MNLCLAQVIFVPDMIRRGQRALHSAVFFVANSLSIYTCMCSHLEKRSNERFVSFRS